MKTVAIIALFLVGVTLALPGGFNKVDVTDEKVLGFVETALVYHNSQSNSDYYKKAVKVVSAQRQVVAGSLYEIEVVVGETHCAKVDEAAELCPVDNNGQQEKCVFRVWEKLAPLNPEVVSVSCTNLN